MQAALGELLALGAEVRAAIAARVADNRARLRAALPPASGCTLLPAEGGWSAILRLPASRTDEAWAAAWRPKTACSYSRATSSTCAAEPFWCSACCPPPDLFAAAIARVVADVEAVLR